MLDRRGFLKLATLAGVGIVSVNILPLPHVVMEAPEVIPYVRMHREALTSVQIARRVAAGVPRASV